jgi:hypothetical protein
MRNRLTNGCCPAVTCVLALGALLSLGACAGKKSKPEEKPAITAPVYVGSIAVVNRESHFVLIDLSGTVAAPEVGTELTAISPAGEASRLKVTPERKRPFVAADIVTGTPKRGERVYR